jgi:phosphatidylglycerophosphate synthase
MPLHKQHIPWLLAATRALLGPILILGAAVNWNGLTLASIVLTALLSDIYDGILARRWLCDTPAARLFDSVADTVFYLSTAIALFIGEPAIWRHHATLILTLVAVEGARILVDLAKFAKPASYHSYLAKTWGLTLASGILAAFALHRDNPLILAALVLGLASNLESFVITLILPTWRNDVKTIPAALRLRRVYFISCTRTRRLRASLSTSSALRKTSVES